MHVSVMACSIGQLTLLGQRYMYTCFRLEQCAADVSASPNAKCTRAWLAIWRKLVFVVADCEGSPGLRILCVVSAP